MDKNMMKKLSTSQIKILHSGNTLENKYSKNSVNLFYIHKLHDSIGIL